MERGVTLIEIILYIALVSVVIGVIGVVFLGVFSVYERDRQAQHIEAEGAAVLHVMRRAIRNAEGVDNIDPGGSDSRLELSMPDNAQDPTEFARSGTTLEITEDNGNPVALTSDEVEVTELVFRNFSVSEGHDTIRVRFILIAPERADTTGEPYEREFIGSAHLRANYE